MNSVCVCVLPTWIILSDNVNILTVYSRLWTYFMWMDELDICWRGGESLWGDYGKEVRYGKNSEKNFGKKWSRLEIKSKKVGQGLAC